MIAVYCDECGEKLFEITEADSRELIQYRDAVCGPCWYEEAGRNSGRNEIVDVEDLEDSNVKSVDLRSVPDADTRSGYAVAVLASIVSDMHGFKLAKYLPDSELSESTEYRVRKELEEEGLIAQNRNGWQLTDTGEKLAEVISLE